MGVVSDGSYGIKEGLIYSMPVVVKVCGREGLSLFFFFGRLSLR